MWDDVDGWDDLNRPSYISNLTLELVRLIASYDGEVLFCLRKVNKNLYSVLKHLELKVRHSLGSYTVNWDNKIHGIVPFKEQLIYYDRGREIVRKTFYSNGILKSIRERKSPDIITTFCKDGRRSSIKTYINSKDYWLEDCLNPKTVYKVIQGKKNLSPLGYV